MSIKMDGYQLNSPASRWEEGLLCGNGEIGAIALGNPERECIIISHEKLFAPVHNNLLPIPMADHLPKIREMLGSQKNKEAGEYIVELFKKTHPGKSKIWTNPFFPACDLNIITQVFGEVHNYVRTMNFDSGEAVVAFSKKSVNYTRSVFVSRANNILVLHLETQGGASSYDISLSQHALQEENMYSSGYMFEETPFLQPQVTTYDGTILYKCGYRDRKSGYAAIARIISCDGEVCTNESGISIRNAHSATVILKLIPCEDLSMFSKEREDMFFETVSTDYAQLLGAHEAIHKERYNRISLQLGEQHTWTDDQELWLDARNAPSASTTFMEKIFNAGRYEILSSCGIFPPNLQGVWTGTYQVPWCSDYTQNGNVQTAILSLLPSGDFENMLSYFNYQESLLDDYRVNSKELYGCRGIHVPSHTSDSGMDFHFDEKWPMIYWTAGAGWVAHFYYDYWLYTGDDDFFLTRALPFMKEAAIFYEDFLIEDENGYWLFSPSYSPENTPINRDAPTCMNATMDIAVAKELFSNLIIGCKTLQIEQENIVIWENILRKMPEYLINADGALKEWSDVKAEDNYDHRHASQLYMLYYGITDDVKSSPDLMKACVKAYEIKMASKKKEQGTMAFGMVQAGMAAAHLHDHEVVEVMLQSMARNNYYITFASSHDYGPSIFNADISGGLPALMLEAVAQSVPIVDENQVIIGYEITLLPAIPKCMSEGEVKGLHLRGGFVLDIQWRKNNVMDYKIHNVKNKPYQVFIAATNNIAEALQKNPL